MIYDVSLGGSKCYVRRVPIFRADISVHLPANQWWFINMTSDGSDCRQLNR